MHGRKLYELVEFIGGYVLIGIRIVAHTVTLPYYLVGVRFGMGWCSMSIND